MVPYLVLPLQGVSGRVQGDPGRRVTQGGAGSAGFALGYIVAALQADQATKVAGR